MKTNNIPCALIKDLLPSYTENLTSPKTAELVGEHLATCQDCREAYERMCGEITAEATGEAEEGVGETVIATASPEIDYLKKVRNTGRKKIIAAVLTVLLLAGGAVFAKVYLYGSPIEDFHMMVSSQSAEASTESGKIGEYEDFMIFSCWIEKSRGQAFTHYKIKDTDEGKEVVLYAAPASIFHRETTMQIQIPEDLAESITIKGDTYGEHGWITKKAKELFAARNPYIGDISADQKLANILGVGEKLGSYKNKLDTEEKEGFEYPYGWQLIFDEAWKEGEVSRKNDRMKAYAYALIALIDNCGEISWTYTTEDGATHTERVRVSDWDDEHSQENISPYVRRELKDYAKYDYTVQTLLSQLEIE